MTAALAIALLAVLSFAGGLPTPAAQAGKAALGLEAAAAGHPGLLRAVARTPGGNAATVPLEGGERDDSAESSLALSRSADFFLPSSRTPLSRVPDGVRPSLRPLHGRAQNPRAPPGYPIA